MAFAPAAPEFGFEGATGNQSERTGQAAACDRKAVKEKRSSRPRIGDTVYVAGGAGKPAETEGRRYDSASAAPQTIAGGVARRGRKTHGGRRPNNARVALR